MICVLCMLDEYASMLRLATRRIFTKRCSTLLTELTVITIN